MHCLSCTACQLELHCHKMPYIRRLASAYILHCLFSPISTRLASLAPPWSSPIRLCSIRLFFPNPASNPPKPGRLLHIPYTVAPSTKPYLCAMEMEKSWCLHPASKESQELEEAAAALMDLAGVERQEVFEPRSMLELKRLGVDCRRRGTELVVWWDGDCRVQGLLEVDATTMAGLRSRAEEADSSSSEPMSELIRVTKYAGVAGFGVRYMSKKEHTDLLVKAIQQPDRRASLGVPLSWTAGFPGLHLPGCSHR